MKNSAGVVIVGGGVIGCSIAYELAKRNVKDIVLLEKNSLASGATGRCGAGVRQQWGTEMNLKLSIGSVKRFETLQEELDYAHDIEFEQSGYFMPAYTEKQVEQFKKNVALQRKYGLNVEWLTPEEAPRIVPIVNTKGLLAATFHQKDGHLNPFHVTFAYAQAAKRLGVEICCHTELKEVFTENGKISGVLTSQGKISCDILINASGGWSQEVGLMAGVAIPTYSERHQILITEPYEALFKPMVMSFYHNFYTQQEPNGAIIMGIGDPNEPKGFNMDHTLSFARKCSQLVTEVLPPLKNARMIRQWSGMYNMSPDKTPIIGEAPQLKGFYMACGFSGHGFMIAPVTSTLIAQMICGEALDIPEVKNKLDLGRFERGELFIEPSVV
ncbi:MAG TPA: FAD-binding oxidoreductase [Caldisericia bacterium]|nr:FAD-binding oxidoreductase [Caldisericia bacterium]